MDDRILTASVRSCVSKYRCCDWPSKQVALYHFQVPLHFTIPFSRAGAQLLGEHALMFEVRGLPVSGCVQTLLSGMPSMLCSGSQRRVLASTHC
jgi:hypothetical protein